MRDCRSGWFNWRRSNPSLSRPVADVRQLRFFRIKPHMAIFFSQLWPLPARLFLPKAATIYKPAARGGVRGNFRHKSHMENFFSQLHAHHIAQKIP
jgi:hypothetical protein